MSRPIVALDFDGVLNPLVPDPDPVRDPSTGHVVAYTTHEIRVPAERVPDSPFIRGSGRKDLAVSVRVNAAHASWIRHLAQHADVVWATTWEEAANSELAPLLGIDPLEVAIDTRRFAPRFREEPGWWKYRALQERYPERPLVWVDDMAGYAASDADHVHRTHNLVTTENERLFHAAREYRWDNHDDFAPRAHFEDTWTQHGFLVTSAWTTIVGAGGGGRTR